MISASAGPKRYEKAANHSGDEDREFPKTRLLIQRSLLKLALDVAKIYDEAQLGRWQNRTRRQSRSLHHLERNDVCSALADRARQWTPQFPDLEAMQVKACEDAIDVVTGWRLRLVLRDRGTEASARTAKSALQIAGRKPRITLGPSQASMVCAGLSRVPARRPGARSCAGGNRPAAESPRTKPSARRRSALDDGRGQQDGQLFDCCG